MPLHLLGKKSWNVYNADNIARVRRDEAAAKAAEEAEEQRMQELDAQRRLAILRGEVPPPIEDAEPPQTDDSSKRRPDVSRTRASEFGRKRKRHGEDDTDFEMRVAKERNELVSKPLAIQRKTAGSAPIVDQNGHIDLIGDERTRAHAEKNEEAEAESRKKKEGYEDQYKMRFSRAAGKDGLNNPWYSKSDMAESAPPMKDVWGNEDPGRKERDTQRIVSNDPLAMMKKGASKVRELNKERRKFQDERDEELRQLKREERDREKKRRRRHERERDRTSSRYKDQGRRSRSRERETDHRREDLAKDRKRRSSNDGRERRRDSRSPDRERHRQRRH